MPYMEFLRKYLKETAANTWTCEEIPTPASKTELMAVLIHQIRFWIPMPAARDGLRCEFMAQLISRDSNEPLSADDPGYIHGVCTAIECGTAEGTLDEYEWTRMQGAETLYFNPPLLYAKDKLYLGVKGTNLLVPYDAVVVIGYTLERVSREEFIAALVE